MEYENKRQVYEWTSVRDEFLREIPELKALIPQVENIVNAQLQSNQQFRVQTATRNGKLSAIHQILQGYGFYNQVAKSQAGGSIKNAADNMPDAKAGGTKASKTKPTKRIWKTSEIKAMNDKTYLKHEKEIDQAMQEGRIVRDT